MKDSIIMHFLKPIEKPNFDVAVGTIKAVIDVDG